MVQKYQALVYTVCHQLVPDAGDAQDLTQETFLAAWRAIDRCPPGYEKQWLARIASNKAKDYLRSAWVRRVNTPGDEVLALEGAPPGSQPEQQVLDTLGEEELTQMILDLREPYKQNALPSGTAGTAHGGAGCTAVRPTTQNGGSAGLPGQKDAGTANFSPARKRREEERTWSCLTKMAA